MTPGPSKGCQMDGKGCRQATPLGFEDHVLEDSGVLYLGSSLYTSKLFLGELVLTKKTFEPKRIVQHTKDQLLGQGGLKRMFGG